MTAASAFETATIGFLPMNIIETQIRKNNQLAYFFIKELAMGFRHIRHENRKFDTKAYSGKIGGIFTYVER